MWNEMPSCSLLSYDRSPHLSEEARVWVLQCLSDLWLVQFPCSLSCQDHARDKGTQRLCGMYAAFRMGPGAELPASAGDPVASVRVKNRQIQASRLEPQGQQRCVPEVLCVGRWALLGFTRTFGTSWQPPILNIDCAC